MFFKNTPILETLLKLSIILLILTVCFIGIRFGMSIQ